MTNKQAPITLLSVAMTGVYKDSLGRISIEQSVNRNRSAARAQMLPVVSKLAQALHEGHSRRITDWGGGWSWTAEVLKGDIVGTTFDVEVLGHKRQPDGTVEARLAQYYWGDGGKSDAVLVIKYRPNPQAVELPSEPDPEQPN